MQYASDPFKPEPDATESPAPTAVGGLPVPHPLAMLCLLARLHDIVVEPETLAHQLGFSPSDALTEADLLRAAKHIGLQAKFTRTPVDRLNLAALPALAQMRNAEGQTHWVLLAQCDGRPTIEPLDVFSKRWMFNAGQGALLVAASRASLAGDLAKFDFSWLIPSIVKYRKLIGEVLLVRRGLATID